MTRLVIGESEYIFESENNLMQLIDADVKDGKLEKVDIDNN